MIAAAIQMNVVTGWHVTPTYSGAARAAVRRPRTYPSIPPSGLLTVALCGAADEHVGRTAYGAGATAVAPAVTVS
ncbi:hypothetical protein JCM4914_61410 [Streptomyces platensis subsp. malvinus]